MQFTACACPAESYRRDHRPWWMKLAGSDRRLYRCYGCDAHMLISQRDVERRLREEKRSREAAHGTVAL